MGTGEVLSSFRAHFELCKRCRVGDACAGGNSAAATVVLVGRLF